MGSGHGPIGIVFMAIIGIPTWGLPVLCGVPNNIHNASGAGFLIGRALHLGLWFAFWERKKIAAWFKKK